MLQTIFKNKKRGFVAEVTVPADFQAEVDALSPRLQYCVEMGWKQSIADSNAGIKDQAAYEAVIFKKWDRVVKGTVSTRSDTPREPSKSPLEKEMWAIASKDMEEALANWVAKNGELTKANRNGLIHQYMVKHNESIMSKATENLAKMGTLAAKAGPDLDEVLAALAKPADESVIEAPAKRAAGKR